MAYAIQDCGCEDGWIAPAEDPEPGRRVELAPCPVHNRAVWERLAAGEFPDNKPLPRARRVPREHRWARPPERADIDG